MKTPLDQAHAIMVASPEDNAAGLKFYEHFAATELFLILEQEADGENICPLILETSDGRFVLAFDHQDRLAKFVQTPTDFVAMSGRNIVKLLAQQNIGIGLNLDVAPSSMLLPPDAVDWLETTLGIQSTELHATPEKFYPPNGLPQSLIESIDAKLANMSGVVSAAYLVGVGYSGGQQGHMLALLDVPHAAQNGVAEAISEALKFSDIEAGQLDVTFLKGTETYIHMLEKNGLGFEIPELLLPKAPQPVAPGMDPDKPPKLR